MSSRPVKQLMSMIVVVVVVVVPVVVVVVVMVVGVVVGWVREVRIPRIRMKKLMAMVHAAQIILPLMSTFQRNSVRVSVTTTRVNKVRLWLSTCSVCTPVYV